MSQKNDFGWDRLRHGGLLLDTERLTKISEQTPETLPESLTDQLRRKIDALMEQNPPCFGIYGLCSGKYLRFFSQNGHMVPRKPD